MKEKLTTGTLVCLLIAMFGVLAIAGNLTDIPVEAGIAKIKEVVNANNALFNSGTVTQANLTATGTVTAVTVTASGTVSGEQLTSTDDALITDDLTVSGLVSVAESVTAEHLQSTDDAVIGDDLAVTGTITVTEGIALNGDLTVDGVAGWGGIVTNATGITNLIYYHEGVVTNVVTTQ